MSNEAIEEIVGMSIARWAFRPAVELSMRLTDFDPLAPRIRHAHLVILKPEAFRLRLDKPGLRVVTANAAADEIGRQHLLITFEEDCLMEVHCKDYSVQFVDSQR